MFRRLEMTPANQYPSMMRSNGYNREGQRFKPRSRDWLSTMRFVTFPRSVQTNPGTVPQIMPWPLPSKSYPIHYSLTTRLYTLQSEKPKPIGRHHSLRNKLQISYVTYHLNGVITVGIFLHSVTWNIRAHKRHLPRTTCSLDTPPHCKGVGV
jgi:hypothetical protein